VWSLQDLERWSGLSVSQACAVYLRTQDGQRQAPGPRREEGQHTSPCGVCGISTNTWHRPAKIGKGEREISRKRDRWDRDKTQDTFVWWCLTKGWIVINKYKMEQTDPDVTKMKIQQILYLCLKRENDSTHTYNVYNICSACFGSVY